MRQLALFPEGKFAADSLQLLGMIAFREENYRQAKAYLAAAQDHPQFSQEYSQAGESLTFGQPKAARC